MAIEVAHINESEYNEILLQAVAVLNNARGAVAQSISTISNTAYWQMGKLLHERKLEGKYGDGIVKRLSIDLKQQFPNIGVSPRQLWNMKRFFVRYSSSDEKVLRSVAVLPWSHILMLMSKELDDTAVLYYANEIVSKGWNRDLLLNAIKLEMHKRNNISASDNNFSSALPATQAMYANEVFKGRYSLGFLGIIEPVAELELERRLVEKIKLFLLELGKGFTFIGEQYVIEYNGKESRIDMLFYHRGLRCLVAFELKIGKFIPEYAGKMNYYLSVLDRTERRPDENPSIGIILCAEKNNVDVELALEGVTKPIGVADYQLVIPKEELKKVVNDEIELYERDLISQGNESKG